MSEFGTTFDHQHNRSRWLKISIITKGLGQVNIPTTTNLGRFFPIQSMLGCAPAVPWSLWLWFSEAASFSRPEITIQLLYKTSLASQNHIFFCSQFRFSVASRINGKGSFEKGWSMLEPAVRGHFQSCMSKFDKTIVGAGSKTITTNHISGP